MGVLAEFSPLMCQWCVRETRSLDCALLLPANRLCPVCFSLGMDYPLTNQLSAKT